MMITTVVNNLFTGEVATSGSRYYMDYKNSIYLMDIISNTGNS